MKTGQQMDSIDKLFNEIVNEIIGRRKGSEFTMGTFNTRDLPEFVDNNGYAPNTDEKYNYLFEKMDKMEHDCLYWFELDTEEKAKELIKLLDDFRIKNKDEKNKRVVPAPNQNSDKSESKVLYVGIRRGNINNKGLTNIVGRINQHLGYYNVGSTQGLQLVHYAKGKDFNITLNVVEFEDMDNSIYLNIIEKLVAKELKPLCGRH